MISQFLPIIAGIFLSVLALVVISNKRIDRYHAYFSLFLFMAAAWSVGVGMFFITTNDTIAYWLVTAFYIAALMIAYSVLIFARAAPSMESKRRVKKIRTDVALLLPVLLMAGWMVTTNGFFSEVHAAGAKSSYHLVILPYLLYVALFVIYVAWALLILVRTYSARRHRLGNPYRTGLKLVAGSIGFGMSFGIVFNLLLPALGVYSFIWLGPVGIIPSAFIFWYAILRHGFFDIRLIVVRTLGYVLSIITLAVVYLLLAYLVSFVFLQSSLATGVSFSPVNVLFALMLAFIFQPVKMFFDKITNSIFYRDRYNPEEFFALLSNVLSTTTDLRSLLERASDVISMTFKSRQTFFFIRYETTRHLSAGSAGHSSFLVEEADYLDSLMAREHGGVIATVDAGRHRREYDLLTRRKVALLLPLWHDGVVLGYLALGEGLAGYARRDLRVLETIADELVIAIQNALSLEQVREVNATLQTRIDTATHSLRLSNEKLRKLDDTKDEFISMASHQLRTPLTSVKGYVSMILDGDAGPVNAQQRKFLTEAFDSSNRMAGIIGDFLNVSRLQTGKFSLEREQIDLSEVVASEVEHLQNTASVRGLTLHYRKPARFASMALDKSKIEQVIMNFIDNAIFYAPDTGTIDIELFQRAGRAVFTVRDYGIGVPKSEQASLFTKFFRATNARRKRPDGTGVGLFLAKKVVVAHKGAIIFESEEGKGSTFGFEIPIRTVTEER